MWTEDQPGVHPNAGFPRLGKGWLAYTPAVRQTPQKPNTLHTALKVTINVPGFAGLLKMKILICINR